MRIKVRFHFTMRKYDPGDSGFAEMELPDGGTVGDLLTVLGAPADADGLTLVGGRPADVGTPIRPGDEVNLFPVVTGG